MVLKSFFAGFLNHFRSVGQAFFVLAITGIYACGGGGSSDSSPNTPPSDFEEFTVSASGGDFSLSNGLTISIPPNAVAQEMTLRFRTLNEADLQMPADIFRQMNKQLVAAFEAQPAGLVFSSPITITFSGPSLFPPSSLIYPLELNTAVNITRTPANKTTKANKADFSPVATGTSLKYYRAALEDYEVDLSTVTVNADGSVTLPDISSLPAEARAIVLMALEDMFDISECEAIPCRCGAIRIESDDFDSGSAQNDDCYSAYADGYVQYLDCPGQPIEPWSLHEANLDVTVTPTDASIKVEDIVYFSFALSDENGQAVTGFAIENLTIDNPAVITDINIGADSIGIKGLAVGIATAEVILQSSSCQYKAWFTVEVEPRTVIAPHRVSVPEGNHTGFGIKLSDPPPSDQSVTVAAFVDGDEDIAIVAGDTLTFTPANWSIDQIILVSASEDDDDASNGEAVITLLPDSILYESNSVTVSEIDNDTVNFLTSGISLAVPEGGSAALHVKLNIEPEDTITTSTTLLGDPSITLSGSALSFDSANWDAFQPLLFSASGDADCDSGVATLTLGDTSGTVSPVILGITEIEMDNDCDIPAGGGGGGDDDDDPTVEILGNHLYIQGSKANWDGSRARWWGVVPIAVIQVSNSQFGDITGSGMLSYSNSYSWLSYPHAGYNPWWDLGLLVECYYSESGILSVQMSGTRYYYPDVMPRYLATAQYTRHMTTRESCADGFYWTEDFVDDFGSKQFTLWDQNGYADFYFDATISSRGELLNKSDL